MTLKICLEHVEKVVFELFVKFEDVVQESKSPKEFCSNRTQNPGLVLEREEDPMSAVANPTVFCSSFSWYQRRAKIYSDSPSNCKLM